MSKLLIVLLIGVVVILVVGVAVFFVTKSVFTKEPVKPPIELCGVKEACPQGKICSALGECIEENTCLVSGDCPEGEVCIGKLCYPNRCKVKEECGPEGFCIEGLCKPRCTNSSQCPGSQACISGVCTPRSCLYQGDCGVEEGCIGLNTPVYGIPPEISLTKPGKAGVCRRALNSCSTNGDCSPGLICSEEKVCIQCRENINCTGNEICSGGLCFSPTQVECPERTKLFSPCNGVICPIFPVCCSSSCNAPCKEDSKVPSACPYCVGGKYLCLPSPEIDYSSLCSKDKPCKGSDACVNGVCNTYSGTYGNRCVTNKDCLAPTTCKEVSSGINICTV